MGVHFLRYRKSSPASPIRDQATELFFRLRFEPVQNEGGGRGRYGEIAVVDHGRSEWTWSQAARGRVTLARCGTSLGLGRLVPVWR